MSKDLARVHWPSANCRSRALTSFTQVMPGENLTSIRWCDIARALPNYKSYVCLVIDLLRFCGEDD